MSTKLAGVHVTAIGILIIAFVAYWLGHTQFFANKLSRYDHLGYVFNGTGAAEAPLY